MPRSQSLYDRIHKALKAIRIIDTHEHTPPDKELPSPKQINIGRFFLHYASCDLVSAGMKPEDMLKVQNTDNDLDDKQRWKLLKPYYRKAWNTAYCESLRIICRDLFGVEDLRDDTVIPLVEAMRKKIKPGWNREVFDRAGIDYAMVCLGPQSNQVFKEDAVSDCFLVDMFDPYTSFPIASFVKETGHNVSCLADYLKIIDIYFDKYARRACAFKVAQAYCRTLLWQDVTQSEAEPIFNRLLAYNDRPDRRDMQALEDFVLHYLVRKCGEHNLTIKFHTGIQEGNGNMLSNSRAALLNNLFLKYPQTRFDIFHISYPYQEELTVLCKNFQNVFIDFCWMWIINPAAARRALSEMLDTVPANKIHGFGGDYIFVEGAYGHATIARREIAQVLCEKVEGGRFSEEYAMEVGRMILRDNAIENFGLKECRKHNKLK